MIILIDADSIAYDAAGSSSSVDMVKTMIDKRMSSILEGCSCNNYKSYIESRNNKHIFRNDIAKSRPYKGNRSNAKRPEFLNEAKECLIETWGTIESPTFESEDMVIRDGYKYKKENCIIAAIDKDLKNHAFTFYNYRTGETETITETQASINLWRQVATGDHTDNIPGIPGIGKAKAAFIQKIGDCVALYKMEGYSYEYFIEQYNLIYIRPQAHTNLLYPISRENWNNA